MDIKAIQTRLTALGYSPGAIDGDLGPKTYAAIMGLMARKQPTTTIIELAKGCNQHLPKYGLETKLRLAHFLAQGAAETGGFRLLRENLNYSAKRLTQVWPSRFRTIEAAAPYAHNPEALANKTYGGRMGNTSAGDGWKYIGRGFKMLTGKHNYQKFGTSAGVDLINHPELAEDPITSILIACEYWKQNDIATWADRDDLQKVTKIINGGLIGFDQRSLYLKRAKGILL